MTYIISTIKSGLDSIFNSYAYEQPSIIADSECIAFSSIEKTNELCSCFSNYCLSELFQRELYWDNLNIREVRDVLRQLKEVSPFFDTCKKAHAIFQKNYVHKATERLEKLILAWEKLFILTGENLELDKELDKPKITLKNANKIIDKLQEYLKNTINAEHLDLILPYVLAGSPADSYQTNQNALILALRSHRLNLVDFLLSHEANINAVVEQGESALMVFVRSASLEQIKFLVEHGANVNHLTIIADTALNFADRLQTDNKAIIQQYLEMHGGRRLPITERIKLIVKRVFLDTWERSPAEAIALASMFGGIGIMSSIIPLHMLIRTVAMINQDFNSFLRLMLFLKINWDLCHMNISNQKVIFFGMLNLSFLLFSKYL